MFRTKNLAEISTWELADELYRFRRIELEHPKKSSFALAGRATQAAQILVERYAGLLCQITSRSAIVKGTSIADRESLEIYTMRTFFKLRDGTWGNLTRHTFATTLWNCVIAQLRADTIMTPAQEVSVQKLKPKFMLRQFLDEMPRSYEKALLLAGAFSTPTDSGEIWREIPQACRKLHQTVLKSSSSVSALTDRAITDQDLSKSDILQRYQRWLVRS